MSQTYIVQVGPACYLERLPVGCWTLSTGLNWAARFATREAAEVCVRTLHGTVWQPAFIRPDPLKREANV